MSYVKKAKREKATAKVLSAFWSCKTFDQWGFCIQWWESIKDFVDVDAFDIAYIFRKVHRNLKTKL